MYFKNILVIVVSTVTLTVFDIFMSVLLRRLLYGGQLLHVVYAYLTVKTSEYQ